MPAAFLQAVALLLPRFVRHMPAPVRAMVLPGKAGCKISILLCCFAGDVAAGTLLLACMLH
jgi:hypothetical protein